MSVIVAVRKDDRAVIGTDSAQADGAMVVPRHYYRDYSKLLRCGRWWLGVAGWSAVADAMESIVAHHGKDLAFGSRRDVFESARTIHGLLKDEYYVETREERDQPVESSQLSVMIVGPEGVFEFESYRSVSEYARFWAIGSGKSLALGAMHAVYDRYRDPRDVAKAGLEAACELDDSCLLPLEFRRVRLLSGA